MDREGEDVEARADVRDRRWRAAPHRSMPHSTASAGGNRREQVDSRIPGNRCVETPKIPCVFAVHVDVHKTLQRAVTLKDPLLERLPVSIRHEVEEAAEGPFELDLDLPFAARRDGNRRGQDEPNHDGGLLGTRRLRWNSVRSERAAGKRRATPRAPFVRFPGAA